MRENVHIVGTASQAGTYVLRIRAYSGRLVWMGKGKRHRQVSFPKGEYLYVGSARALNPKMATSLGKRLVRHASRTNGEHQAIREAIIEVFASIGLGPADPRPRAGKSYHWAVDYFLDDPEVELTHVYAIRCSEELETALGKQLELDAATRIVERGMGAGGVPGNTHLLAVQADDVWWGSIPGRLRDLAGDAT